MESFGTTGFLARKWWNLGLCIYELMSGRILWITSAFIGTCFTPTLVAVSVVGMCFLMVSGSSKLLFSISYASR
jgi:hypothetical protein